MLSGAKAFMFYNETTLKLLFFAVFYFVTCCNAYFFTWDYESIKDLRQSNKTEPLRSRAVSASLLRLWEESNKDMINLSDKKFPSVFDKNFTVFGTKGDKSFYSSVVPYAFPCDEQPSNCKDYHGKKFEGHCNSEGLPWVICDGSFNQKAAKLTDRPSLEKMMHAVMRLSLAGFIFGEKQKSSAAAEHIRTWFMRPESRMQPNLKFGQGIPGVIHGRGSASMDMYFSGRGFVDAIQLLTKTPGISSFWTKEDEMKIKQWASQFSKYMFYDRIMQGEKRMANNHGAYYDLNVLAWASIARELSIIRMINGSRNCFRYNNRVYNCLQGRFASQVNSEGIFHHEINRADHSHYVWYTLLANAYLATAGDRISNRAGFHDADLERAAEWAFPYIVASQDSKVEGKYVYAAHAYRMLSRGMKKEKYEFAVCQVLDALSQESRSGMWKSAKVGVHILNIVMPAMYTVIEESCPLWKNYDTLHESEKFIRAAKNDDDNFSPSNEYDESNFSLELTELEIPYQSLTGMFYTIITILIPLCILVFYYRLGLRKKK